MKINCTVHLNWHTPLKHKAPPYHLNCTYVSSVNIYCRIQGAWGPGDPSPPPKKSIKSGVVALSTCSGTWVGVRWLLVNKVKM